MFAAVAIGIPAPLGAGHILWINLITDSLPALALGMDGNDRENLMRQPPRRTGESLFAGGGWFCMVFYGSLIAAITLGAFFSRQELCGADVCIYRSGAVGALSCGRHALAHGLGIFAQSWENPLMLAAFLVGVLMQVGGDGDSFFDETPSHGAAAPGRVAGASPVVRHAAVSA